MGGRAAVIGIMTGALAALGAVSASEQTGSSAARTAAVHNVNFRGTWIAPYGDWTIKSENFKTGACAGRSAVAGFRLINCKVSGHHYRFVIAQNGTAYRSVNTGTISGNTIHGGFSDSNGTRTPYVAHRRVAHRR